MPRLQQAKLVVEPQLPPGDLRDLGKFADTKHTSVRPPAACLGRIIAV
jgi:hypothetical protein